MSFLFTCCDFIRHDTFSCSMWILLGHVLWIIYRRSCTVSFERFLTPPADWLSGPSDNFVIKYTNFFSNWVIIIWSESLSLTYTWCFIVYHYQVERLESERSRLKSQIEAERQRADKASHKLANHQKADRKGTLVVKCEIETQHSQSEEKVTQLQQELDKVGDCDCRCAEFIFHMVCMYLSVLSLNNIVVMRWILPDRWNDVQYTHKRC